MEHTWYYGGKTYPFDISESESMARMCGGLNTLREEIGALGGDSVQCGRAYDGIHGVYSVCQRAGECVPRKGRGRRRKVHEPRGGTDAGVWRIIC